MSYKELVEFMKIGLVNPQIISTVESMRNELCLKCGKYKNAHLGNCKGCRWE